MEKENKKPMANLYLNENGNPVEIRGQTEVMFDETEKNLKNKNSNKSNLQTLLGLDG